MLQRLGCVSAVLLLTAAAVGAQGAKKPVTLEALAKMPPAAAPGEPVWAPDGKRFVYEEDRKLHLYDAAARKGREVLSLAALEGAAVKVPPAPAFNWQNRRVAEQRFQWFPSSTRLLAVAGGDLFLVNLDAGGFVQLTATSFAESDPKLSPDGTRVSYRAGRDLWAMHIETGKTTRLTSDGSETLWNGELDWVYPEELDLGTAHWWSPDSRYVAYLQFDVSRQLIHPHVDLLGLFAKPEPQRYPKAGTPNADVRLGVVAARGGRTGWMDVGETRDKLLARVHWLPDSSGLFVQKLNRVQNRLELLRTALEGGEPRAVLVEEDKYWVNLHDMLRFLPERKQFLWASERDGFRHMYLYGMDGALAAQLTSGEWEVSALAGVDEAGGQAYYVSTEASPLERHLYRVALGGGERRRLTAEPGTHAISMGSTTEFFTDTFSNLEQPAARVLRSTADGSAVTLRAPDRRVLDEFDILPTELVSFNGPDGTRFHARLIKPAGFTPEKKYPVVVMVYGGPHAQYVVNRYAGANADQALAHRGFAVWQMDNRGSAGRGHLWEAKLYRRFGHQELEDQKAGVAHLLSMGFADPERIGIQGWSYGGYMTLYALLHAPETFAAGVSGAPVTDWRNYDTIYTERYLGLPSENEKGYRESSVVHYAAGLKGRLLLIHNFGDDNVLYQQSMQMQVALQNAGKQYELLVYPQKAHGVTGKLAAHMREAVVSFFERTLKP